MTPISLKKLRATHRALIARGVRYGLGAKAPSMRTKPSEISRIDCSGEFRYLIAQATDQKLIIPDGSWNQRKWFEDNDFKQVPYVEVAKADPHRLFAAFITAGVNGCGRVGHVWLVNDGSTLESYGGHGVGSRKWSVKTLVNQVHECFELPTVEASTPAEPPKLILNGKIVADAYLTGGHWFAREGELAQILGGTTYTPYLPVLVADTIVAWGWEIEKYTQRLATENRAYIRAVRI